MSCWIYLCYYSLEATSPNPNSPWTSEEVRSSGHPKKSPARNM